MAAARNWLNISANISTNPAILCVALRRFIDEARTFSDTTMAGMTHQASRDVSGPDRHHQLLGYSSETKVTNYKFLAR
jgi:hypothetical protein